MVLSDWDRAREEHVERTDSWGKKALISILAAAISVEMHLPLIVTTVCLGATALFSALAIGNMASYTEVTERGELGSLDGNSHYPSYDND